MVQLLIDQDGESSSREDIQIHVGQG
jgi:hypothetical protein